MSYIDDIPDTLNMCKRCKNILTENKILSCAKYNCELQYFEIYEGKVTDLFSNDALNCVRLPVKLKSCVEEEEL